MSYRPMLSYKPMGFYAGLYVNNWEYRGMPSFLNQHLGHPTAVVSINLMILNGTSCLFSISSYLDSRSVISLKIKKSHGSIKILTRMKSWEKIKLYKFLNEKNRLKISILISNVRSMKCSAGSVSPDHQRSQWELIHLDWVYIAVWISAGIGGQSYSMLV